MAGEDREPHEHRAGEHHKPAKNQQPPRPRSISRHAAREQPVNSPQDEEHGRDDREHLPVVVVRIGITDA